MLEQLHDNLWLCDGPAVDFHGFAYPTRCVIARLQDGGLWVWSPTPLHAPLQAAVDRLGPVRHLVCPNKLHYLFLRDWQTAYPHALLWAPQSLQAKCRGFEFQPPLRHEPPPQWQDEFAQTWFQGSPAMDEIVFLHRASGTVIVADLIQSFSETFLREHWRWWQRPLAAVAGITAAHPAAPLDWRLSFLGRAKARAARDQILAWPSRDVIVAHGECRRGGGRAFLAQAFDWLGP